MNFLKIQFWHNLPGSVKWIYRLYLIRILIYLAFYTLVFILVRKGLSDSWTDLLPYMVFRKAHIAKAFDSSGLGYAIGFLGVQLLFRIFFSIGQLVLLNYRRKVWYWIFLSISVLQTIARFHVPIIPVSIIILGLLSTTKKYLNKNKETQEARILDIFIDSPTDFRK